MLMLKIYVFCSENFIYDPIKQNTNSGWKDEAKQPAFCVGDRWLVRNAQDSI